MAAIKGMTALPLVVLGSNLAAASFLRWYRVFDTRKRVYVVAETDIIGVPRSVLPYVAMGLLSANHAYHLSRSFVEEYLHAELVTCSLDDVVVDNDAVKVCGRCVKYDALVVSIGTRPNTIARKLAPASATNLSEALKARELVEAWEGPVYIYGGFEGLNAVDAVEKAGFDAVLCATRDPFDEVFDSDVSSFAKNIIRVRLSEPRPPPRGQGLAFGMEEPRLPEGLELPRAAGDYEVAKGVFVMGGTAVLNTPLGPRMGLSDDELYLDGLLTALAVGGAKVRPPPGCRVATIRGMLLCSCGLTASRASAFKDVTSVRVRMRARGGAEGLVKITARRSTMEILGFQCVLPRELYGEAYLLYATFLAETCPSKLLAAPRFMVPLAGYASRAMEALWRKLVVRGVRAKCPSMLPEPIAT